MKFLLWAAQTDLMGKLKASIVVVYNVVLSMGGPGLFLLALADSSFLSVPEGNDVLIVVLSTGKSWNLMAYYVAMTTLGSVAGCSILYAVGRRGGGYFRRKLRPERLADIRKIYRKWGVLAILIPSVLPPPTPFKVFVLSAGLFGLSFAKFFLSVLVGRSIRYSLWGILAVLYGEAAKSFLETNLRRIGLVIFLLIIAGMVLYLLLWLKARRKSRLEAL